MSKKARPPYRLKRSMRALAAGSLAFGALLSAHAEATGSKQQPRRLATAHDQRWQASFDAFAAADLLRAPQPGGVVFVGSSSIRLWNGLEQAFGPELKVIKRGFGGSRLADCTAHVDQLVLRYKPRLVVVYAGDNDLAEGASPEDVLRSFEAFVDGVLAELPDTRVAYLSIKPSPLREPLMPAAFAANALIEGYAAAQPQVEFIDLYSKMIGPDGRPRADLYGGDRLHLNDAGYALWRAEIAARLKL
jgi:lysophospholipase L1-like esterase